MPSGDADGITSFTFSECTGTDGQVQFTDDGTVDGNYGDSRARIDTTEICPTDAWSRVTVKFINTFDIETMDLLEVYDGNQAAVGPATLIDDGTGQGVSQINGAWVTASCSPTTNPSGCLTFVFRTDGLNSKGSGWDAWASCEERAAVITPGSIPNTTLTCMNIADAGAASAMVTIPAPDVTLCGMAAGAEDAVTATITNQQGFACLTQVISADAGTSIMDAFGVGSYLVTYTLVADQTKTATSTFTIQAPSLICNDNIEVPFGSACAIQLTPDDLLENPCDELAGVLSYDITITLGSGKDEVTLSTDGGVFPTITAGDLANAGMTVCNATATVTVARTIAAAGTCNNGAQTASCTSTLSFNDQSNPFITLTSTATALVACDASAVASIVSASAIDNCDDDVDVEILSIVMEEEDPCFAANGTPNETSAVITFIATDDCGNTSTLSQTIAITRPNPVDHLVRVGDIDPRDCSEDINGIADEVPMLAIGTLDGAGAFTQTGTVALSENDYVCGYILQKRDVDIPSTDCGQKRFRFWSIVDWCNPSTGPSAIDTSFIEFTDTQAPVLAGGADAFASETIELGAFECTFDVNTFEVPVATDNCDANPVVRLAGVDLIEDGVDWPVATADWGTLACGSYTLTWIAEDDCHEQVVNDTVTQVIIIDDVTKPSAICTDELNISIPSTAGARIHYSDIDAGSFDACGISAIEISNTQDADGNFINFGAYVDIACTDVKTEVTIEMRVTDNKGNQNSCWMIVSPEDKIAPICGDLPNMTFDCDDFHTGELGAPTGGYVALTGDLLDEYNERFGDPFAQCSDNLDCGTLTISQEYSLVELNCGELDINRRWTVTDWSGRVSNTGTQSIDVNYVANWSLTFPADVDLTCNDGFPLASTAEDIISNGTCDLWALEVSEKTFEVPGDICMKIERTYELINWCVYQAGTDAVEVPRVDDGASASIVLSAGNEAIGRYTYVQVLKLYVNEAPSAPAIVMDGDDCLFGEGDLEPFGMADNTPGFAPLECDEERTFSATSSNCADIALASENFTWVFTAGDAAPETGTGYSFTRVVSPKIVYTVEFWVSDGCGNSSGSTEQYQFWDCKKPTPYVLNGLAVQVMQTGSIQLWASDLNQGSYDNCTVKDRLQYRLFAGDPVDGPQELDAILALDENLTFDCNSLGLQNVSFYVIDEEGNFDVVGTLVAVQGNNGACGTGSGQATVAGKITNAFGENVEQVNVSVNGSDNSMATGATGEFQFNLALEGDYTITPEKNINPLNGVSTFDLVLISKHILGLQSFDSPYKYIAADVNKSGTITAFDMVQLRQLILNITSEFSNNSSWRFVDAAHEFTSANPAGENFVEFMNINNLDDNMMNIDFIATKIGDVNGSAQSNSLLGAESRTTNGALTLNVVDRQVEAGQTVTVDFLAADIAATQGYQFTLDFAGLELVSLNEGVAKAANFNTSLAERGVLTTSWNGEATNENLFSITFTATTNGLLSELVSVNSDITTAEAYNNAGELLDVAINFNASNVSATFGLSQNTPNPFNGQTLIGYNLPQAGTATLKVMDVQGKVLTVISQEGVRGYNQVTVDAKSLGATGVLYYQLESADNIATKKMIILE